jgi:hypothetical protein
MRGMYMHRDYGNTIRPLRETVFGKKKKMYVFNDCTRIAVMYIIIYAVENPREEDRLLHRLNDL